MPSFFQRPPIILLLGLLSFSSALPAQEVDRADLHTIIRHDFTAETFLSNGKTETAVYEATDSVGGIKREFQVTSRTRQLPLNREYYVPASYPYGQKPLVNSIHQTWKSTISSLEVTENNLIIIDQSADNFGQLLRLQTNTQSEEQFSIKDFRLWDGEGTATFHSPNDGEPSGEFPLRDSLKDYFEEELPLVLRGLPFKDGLQANLWLYPRQSTDSCTQPRPELAVLTVQKVEKGWKVDLRTRTDRQIQFLFQAELPYPLLAFHHSDGRTLTLKAIEYTND